MVLDWLDRQMVGGELRPDDGDRHDVASHGLQAVHQAVRDSHFNDRCQGAADFLCHAGTGTAQHQPRQIADLRDACSEGALVVHGLVRGAEMLLGRALKVITERRRRRPARRCLGAGGAPDRQ